MLHFDAITDGSTEHDGPNKQYNPTIVFISVCKHTKMDLFTEGTLLRKVSIGSHFIFAATDLVDLLWHVQKFNRLTNWAPVVKLERSCYDNPNRLGIEPEFMLFAYSCLGFRHSFTYKISEFERCSHRWHSSFSFVFLPNPNHTWVEMRRLQCSFVFSRDLYSLCDGHF